jgi:hypothetical protein
VKFAEPDYIVLRAYPEAPPGWMPRDLEGRWYDRAEFVTSLEPPRGYPAKAVPTGRFEVREYDGKVAEIWEVRPA